jgi:4-amino-4-deoxychorismate lyase
MSIPLLSSADILKKLDLVHYAQKSTYFAMYSSWYGGIVRDPSLMLVPIDDHLVHRGDGVFEAMKFVHGKVYLLNAHLDRLESSAAQLSLSWPFPRSELVNIIHETLAASGATEAYVRIFMSRGPGGFSTNPYDSVGTQIYVVVTQFKPLPEEKYLHGVRTGKSLVPPKDPWFATIKSCNYLHNVMMKKEAVDRGLDFTLGFDAAGVLTEGSTENIMLVDGAGFLVRPRLHQILKGTTMMRALHLAQDLVAQKVVRGVTEKDLTEADLRGAREAMMVGTTLDVLPVTEFEGAAIGDGKPGFVAQTLRRLIDEDSRGV